MRRILLFVWETAKIVIIAILIVVPIRYFVFQPFFVRGESMEPNFHNGDYLIVDELSYYLRNPERGEVIVFRYPQNPSQRYIKRIIGMPGETVEIEEGKVSVYDERGVPQVLDESSYFTEDPITSGNLEIKLDDNEYFVLGDNRPFSSDSRRWGTLPEKDIIGRVFLRAWPITAMAKVETPNY